jgi:hypothetical protein
MDDNRIWEFEESLWVGDAANYREKIDDQCLMALPQPPYVFTGEQAIDAVSSTPRWTEVEFSQQQVARPQEGLIVIAYHARTSRDGETYEAHCTTTMHRLAHEVWRVIQHQQTPPLAASAQG